MRITKTYILDCNLLDKLIACGRHKPPVFLDADCTIGLPVNSLWSHDDGAGRPLTLASFQDVQDTTSLEYVKYSNHVD